MEVKTMLITVIFLIAVLAGFFYILNKRSQIQQETTGPAQALTQPTPPQSTQTDTPQAEPNTPTASKPASVLKDGVDYQAVVKTSMGDITIDLFEKEAPVETQLEQVWVDQAINSKTKLMIKNWLRVRWQWQMQDQTQMVASFL